MATANDIDALDELIAEISERAEVILAFPHDALDPRGAAEAAIRAIDERMAARAERERCLHLPTRIVGECRGDHLRRGAPNWVDLPDVLPLGEEGGTAWTPDNAWLREEQEF
ncbi:MAG TPA: hypothetical protein VFN78_13490 [Ktedonobacterales bacterium]|nr:hypothetical protein [Ktedonobacterales bacterium]